MPENIKALTIQAYQLAQIRLAQIITQEASEKAKSYCSGYR